MPRSLNKLLRNLASYDANSVHLLFRIISSKSACIKDSV